jgi:hypothetical protein
VHRNSFGGVDRAFLGCSSAADEGGVHGLHRTCVLIVDDGCQHDDVAPLDLAERVDGEVACLSAAR